jgi:hypothetical protein
MTEENQIVPAYRIHPGIGIARLGDSPDEFCISPEKPAALPIACDEQGNPLLSSDAESEVPVKRFKDEKGRIKRQAARFQLYVYDDENPNGRPLKIGDKIKGGGNHGKLIDIQWQVYLANKKAVWYEFQQAEGEHGYSDSHKRRNSHITNAEARQHLIIDPGAQIVNATDRRNAYFTKENAALYAPTFPPPLTPRSIDTLGELKTDDSGRLLVLGGYGNSGSIETGFGQPRIEHYANNDGWFDDTSDGVVMARLVMYSDEVGAIRFIDVEYPAWVVVGYPGYVPEILDIVTLDDVLQDVAIREFAHRTDLYGELGTFDDPQRIDPTDTAALMHWKRGRLGWNPDYKPWFYRDIWTILFRADEMTYLTNVLEASNEPHNQTKRGTFDPDKLSVPPFVNQTALEKSRRRAIDKNQSGELFIEALEPTLALLDERLKIQTDADLSEGFARALTDTDVRQKLQQAVAAFAATIENIARNKYDEEGLTRNPTEYLKRWQKIYDFAQSAPADDVSKAEYLRAKDALQSEIEEIVNGLFEAVTKSSGLEEKTVMTALTRRIPPDQPAENDVPRPIEDSFELYSKEFRTGKLLEKRFTAAQEECTHDFYRIYRMYLFELLRREGEENQFRAGGGPNSRTFNLPLMPLLAGDNPISNTLPSKFLRLTDYQLFILRQWAEGKFYNEKREGWVTDFDTFQPYKNWTNKTGNDLDRGVLMNLAGGAFCPGCEVGWIIRNPSIYREPYRLKSDPDFYNFRLTAAQANAMSRTIPVSPTDYVSYVEVTLSQDNDFEVGLQPGDLTKQMALPWQSDFNECSSQTIDVTYERWNVIDPESENDPWMKLEEQVWETLWWPAHRPMQTYEVVGRNAQSRPIYKYLDWARGIPVTNAGDLKMVSEWSKLGFVVRNPYIPEKDLNMPSPDIKYISVERNQENKDE